MLSFIKLFARSISRNKLFAFVNLLGLTVGFFSSMVIYLYVKGETDYDKFHANGDRIYRINQTFIWGEDNPNQFSSTGPGVAYAVKDAIPEVEQVTRVLTVDVTPITFEYRGEQKFFNDEWVFAVDSNFFDFFSFELKYGDIQTALKESMSVVLKPEIATKFFGEVNPVGFIIQMDGGESYQVTGVLAEDQPNSYLDEFDALMSLSSIERMKTVNDNWMWTMFETYLMADEGADPVVLLDKINELPKTYAASTLRQMGYTYEEYLEAGKKWDLFLQPVSDIYLQSSNVYNRLSSTGDLKIVFALTGSAIFLIILSCINFINLSTAQFTSRAKDIALRKVMGVSGMQTSARFLSESVLYCLLSAVMALVFLYSLIPDINQSLGTSLVLDPVQQPSFILFVFGLIAFVGAIAGFYPFLFFNAFQPAKTLKGELKTGKKGVSIRNGMLITQYILSFILIICSLTIFDQLNYFMNKDLGFEKENLLAIENLNWMNSPAGFIEEVKEIDGVVNASFCDGLPMLINNGDQFIPDKPEAGSIPLSFSLGDEHYLQTVGIELLFGRGFDDAFGTDSTGIILNETAVRSIGWPMDERILNKKISNWSGEYHVIGVARDFNFWTLYAPIEPFAIFHDEANAVSGRPLSRAAIRIAGTSEELAHTKKALEEKWSAFAPNRPYEMTVLSDHFSESFVAEARFRDVLSFFSMLTIIIASLGLFGIVVFSLEQKLKEIGVRKVLGATVPSLILLFSKGYVKLLFVAFIVAAPVGYFFMEEWLEGFAYRTDIKPLSFVFSFVLLLLISLVITIFHTVKASVANPSEVLKDE